MSVYKDSRRNKPYRYEFYTGNIVNGVRERKTASGFATKKEAADAEALAKADYQTGRYIPPTKLTLKQYLYDMYLPTKNTKSKSTRQANAWAVDIICKDTFVNKKITSILLIDLINFTNALYATSLSDESCYKIVSILKGAFKLACASRIVAYNPAEGLKLPPKPKSKGTHLPGKVMMEQLRLIKQYDYEIYLPLLLMATAGCRIGEVTGIRNSRVNLEDRTLIIDSALNWQENGRLELGSLKSSKAYRTVPLLPIAVEAIKEYRGWLEGCKRIPDKQGLLHLGEWRNPMDLLILQKNGSPLGPDLLESRWSRLKRKHSDLVNIRPHDFRHSYASNMRDAGVAMADIADLLGHEDVAFTAKTYAVALDKTHRAAGEMLQNKLNNA